MPTLYALSWRKKISAMVEDGRASQGETPMPMRIRAAIKEPNDFEVADQMEVTRKRTVPAR